MTHDDPSSPNSASRVRRLFALLIGEAYSALGASPQAIAPLLRADLSKIHRPTIFWTDGARCKFVVDLFSARSSDDVPAQAAVADKATRLLTSVSRQFAQTLSQSGAGSGKASSESDVRSKAREGPLSSVPQGRALRIGQSHSHFQSLWLQKAYAKTKIAGCNSLQFPPNRCFLGRCKGYSRGA